MPLPETARSDFRLILGNENLREGVSCSEFSVQGRVPSAVLFPGAIEEAAACAETCYRNGLAVTPWGGGTRMGFGSPPAKVDVALSTSRMDRVLDYQPADMTVTVEAGLSLSGLQDVLRAQGQHLPLDPPLPRRATLGGIVATRDTGALRHTYGSPRDLLIGLKVVDPEGQIVKGGSKVVKNVAGYDLPKLYAGSWGTLGLLAELTFRVLPLPEEQSTVVVSLPGWEAAETLVAQVLDSDLFPLFIELFNAPACRSLRPGASAGLKVAIGIDGAKEDVEWQAVHLRSFCEAVGAALERLSREEGDVFRRAVADYPLSVESRLTARVSLPGSQVTTFIQKTEALSDEAGHEAAVLSHAGVGVLVLHLTRPPAGEEETLRLLEALREAAASMGGRLSVERAEPSLEGRLDPWPPSGDGLPLMQNIKRSLDPKNLWNPGRFVVK